MGKLFTIFGNPVSHSISPLIHNFTIKQLSINACYSRTFLEDEKEFKKVFITKGFDGANITVPFKEVAFRECDEIKGIANKINAVNTIVKKDNKLIGYNTDAQGFYEGIKEYQDIKYVLIIGAGGTAKAISLILQEKGYKVEILNRSQNRLLFFTENGFNTYSWDTFSPKQYDLVVNTTSAGLKDNNLPLDEKRLEKIFSQAKIAVDVIYNKKTPFLTKAKQSKLIVNDGSFMLLNQAILAFEIFFDCKYPKKDIRRYMSEAMSLL